MITVLVVLAILALADLAVLAAWVHQDSDGHPLAAGAEPDPAPRRALG